MKVKAVTWRDVRIFTDIPNVGPAMVKDFKLLGIDDPVQLRKHTAIDLYQSLCMRTGLRHDPCVLDTFMAVVDFMNGAPAQPWWHYTAQRKKQFPDI